MADRKPTVLITGANGFIGSRLVRSFIESGYDVVAGVRETADLRLLKGLTLQLRYGDVTKRETLPAMVTGADYIIHNAGVVKAKKRESFFDINEAGTRNLFDAIAAHGRTVKRVVFVSSLAAAGPSRTGVPVRESDPPNPVTTYGESKLAGERVALSFAERFSVVIVRPAGVYGPGDRELYTLFKTVYRRLKPYVGDTSRRLQIVHVDDLCRGVMLATTAEVPSGGVYFIAERQAYTIRELVNTLETASGRRALPLVLPAFLFRWVAAISESLLRLVGVTPMLTREKTRELLASWEISIDNAREDLGFESQIDLARGAKETYQWYLKHGWL